MDEHKPLTDAEFAELKADYADKLRLMTELADEADDMKRRIDEEEERRRDHPGADIRKFRPRPNGPHPTDQGTC